MVAATAIAENNKSRAFIEVVTDSLGAISGTLAGYSSASLSNGTVDAAVSALNVSYALMPDNDPLVISGGDIPLLISANRLEAFVVPTPAEAADPCETGFFGLPYTINDNEFRLKNRQQIATRHKSTEELKDAVEDIFTSHEGVIDAEVKKLILYNRIPASFRIVCHELPASKTMPNGDIDWTVFGAHLIDYRPDSSTYTPEGFTQWEELSAIVNLNREFQDSI